MLKWIRIDCIRHDTVYIYCFLIHEHEIGVVHFYSNFCYKTKRTEQQQDREWAKHERSVILRRRI